MPKKYIAFQEQLEDFRVVRKRNYFSSLSWASLCYNEKLGKIWLWGGRRYSGASANPLPKDLVHVDSPLHLVKRGLGLSLLGKWPDTGLA